MTSIDIEDNFVLCDYEQAEEAAAPPSPCGEDVILIDAITALEDEQLVSTSLHEDYNMLTDAVATLEDNQKRQPSTYIDNGFPTAALATPNPEPYISKTAAEIGALGKLSKLRTKQKLIIKQPKLALRSFLRLSPDLDPAPSRISMEPLC